MDHDMLPILICGMLFIGLPWLIFHYVTQWKKGGSMTVEDENLLDELHSLARRLEDRMNTIERIVAADSPSFRPSIRDDRDEDYELPRSREREPQTTRTRRRDH
jgi:phage shock protein B